MSLLDVEFHSSWMRGIEGLMRDLITYMLDIRYTHTFVHHDHLAK